MKKFLLHIGFLLLSIVLLMVIFDLVYTYAFSNAIPRNKFQYIYKMEPQNMDLVFLGSSRVANQISATEVRRLTGGSAINLGVEGASYHDNLLELQLLLQRNIRIKKLVLSIDHYYEFESPSTFGNAAMLPFIREPHMRNHLSELPEFKVSYYVPFYRYMNASHIAGFRELVLSIAGKKLKTDFSDGFIPKNGATTLEGFKLPENLSNHNKYLDSISTICRTNNIKLVLFCAPYCSKTENLEYVAKLKLRFPNMLDYSRAMNDDSFYDCVHLNETGAITFTRMLVDDILKSE